MNIRFLTSLVLASAALSAATSLVAAETDSGPYRVTRTFKVGGAGGWDYLTVDSEHQLLFVPRSTHTLVIDAKNGSTVADIPGQQGNHGTAIVPAVNRAFITDGKGASIDIVDLKSYAVLGKIKAQLDADGVIYDPASDKVLAVSGDGGTLLPLSPNVDPSSGKIDAPVELGGSPEFLAADGKGRAYVNLMDKNEVAAVDTKTMKVTAHWSVAPGGSPVGMDIDREHRRLFIGCRKPQKMIVMSADDGKVLADLPIGAGVDAVKFDDGYALASCGDGTLTVVAETTPGKFAVVQTLKTAQGARTMGLDPKRHTLYFPTAEFAAATDGKRPRAKPDTFMILVAERTHHE